MSHLKKLIVLLPFLYFGVIWYFSSHPSDAIVDTKLSFDNSLKEAMHLIIFGILYLLGVFALKAMGRFNEKTNRIVAGLAILCGLIDEIHQSFVPERSATVIDFIKDTIGVLVCYMIVRRRYLSKTTKANETISK